MLGSGPKFIIYPINYQDLSVITFQVKKSAKNLVRFSEVENAVPCSFTHQLHEELCLDPPGALVFVVRPRGEQRVDLVHEDDAGLMHARHREQRAHHFLAFAHPL